jgi:hypothetical protein
MQVAIANAEVLYDMWKQWNVNLCKKLLVIANGILQLLLALTLLYQRWHSGKSLWKFFASLIRENFNGSMKHISYEYSLLLYLSRLSRRLSFDLHFCMFLFNFSHSLFSTLFKYILIFNIFSTTLSKFLIFQ